MQLGNQILQRRKENKCPSRRINLLAKHVAHGLCGRHRSIRISATVLKTKALYFEKELSYEKLMK